jgi:GT2 family glycosyltransferase
MKVAVIIPTRDRHDALRACLTRVTSADPELDIVVSDDGNVEVTRQVLGADFPNVRFVQGPRQGPAANRNHGAAQAEADLLVFLDDDCVPNTNLIEVYREATVRFPNAGVFEGRISALGSPKGFGDIAPVNETGGHLWSCNFAIRSSVFRELHGFDDRFCFAANEDMDIYVRAKKIVDIVFVPEAQVFHRYETRLGGKMLRHKGMSSVLYIQIHTPQATGHTPFSFLRAAAKSVLVELPQRIREHSAGNPFHLLRVVAYDLRLAVVMAFWSHRGKVARLLYKPCCDGCRQMLDRIGSTSA